MRKNKIQRVLDAIILEFERKEKAIQGAIPTIPREYRHEAVAERANWLLAISIVKTFYNKEV